MDLYVMNLQLFAEEGAAAAPAGGGAEAGTAAVQATAEPSVYNPGDTLPDGTQVANARVAAALNRQMKRHPELRANLGQVQSAPQPAAQPAPGAQQTPAGEPTIEDRWTELKKGEYKEQYARDVQAAIKDRFKNQADLQERLDAIQPTLDVLMKKTGAESVEELNKLIAEDDSIYQEEADAAGMPVDKYREMVRLQKEHDDAIASEKRLREQVANRDRFAELHRQGEDLKQMFPDFDLMKEMENEAFRNMTMSGQLTVEQAFYALHGKELTPQLMAYGMQRARQQMGQTIQATGQRPQEGAMRGRTTAAAEPKINPASLTRKEREMYKQMARRGIPVSFD